MLNQIVLVGRIHTIKKLESEESSRVDMVLAVSRSFKNVEGQYETDYIPVSLWNGVADNTFEYCKVGDIVGVKGRIQCKQGHNVEIVAEKVTFLSSKPSES